MDKFIPCRACYQKSKIEGFITTKLSNGQTALQECNCHTSWRVKGETIVKAEYSNLWSDATSLEYNPLQNYKGSYSRNNMLNLVKYVKHFKDIKNISLYLWGTNGTQKTTLAQWVGLSILKQGYTVHFDSMQNIIKLLHDFSQRTEKDELVKEFLSVDLLILDESFDKEKVSLWKSGFQLPYIESFLKERIESNKKATIFVSNVGVDAIVSQGFSKSIHNLIARNTGGTVLTFTDDYLGNCNQVDIQKINFDNYS